MSDETTKSVVFSGTPAEIGGQIFLKMCLPAVRKLCIEQPPQALVQLYVGFISAAFGAMTADFGADAAEDLVRHCMTALDGTEARKIALH